METKQCKFFLKGNCKHGDNCKFSHSTNSDYAIVTSNQSQPGNIVNIGRNSKKKKPKNTVHFEPITKPVNLRLSLSLSKDKLSTDIYNRDVLLAPCIFNDFAPYEIHDRLVNEIQSCDIDPERLLKLWHGNDVIPGTHYIANDRTNWKKQCPTFEMVINKLCDYFNVIPRATRLNWYQQHTQHKPLHWDQNRFDEETAKKQNITIAVSFGQTREILLQNDKHPDVFISTPSHDGEVYTFTHDINCTWKHGVHIGLPEERSSRISIIIWGQMDIKECTHV